MNRINTCIILLLSGINLTAQESASTISNRAVYVELGGPSIIYSFNYDFTFDRSATGGWGARLGLGATALEDFSFASMPLMVNYLLGKNDSYFEISAGPIINFGSGDVLYIDPDATPVIGSVYFGYRYQPADKGFLLRAGLPIVMGVNSYYDWQTDQDVNEFYCLPYIPGLSLGYAF